MNISEIYSVKKLIVHKKANVIYRLKFVDEVLFYLFHLIITTII